VLARIVTLSALLSLCVDLSYAAEVARPGPGVATTNPPATSPPAGVGVVKGPLPVINLYPVSRREFAQLIQDKFKLSAPDQPVSFPDVRRDDTAYAAIEAAAPYMNEQILCPGCYLHPGFFPDEPVAQDLMGVAIVRILDERKRLVLPSLADAEKSLKGVRGAEHIPQLARPYLAAANDHEFLVKDSKNRLQLSSTVLLSDLDTILNKAEQTRLPKPPTPPPIK
jgi:hypothetical protein